MANERIKKDTKSSVKRLNINEMPHSIEAEKSLLGCLLMDVKIQVETAAFLSPEDFYSEANQTVFAAMNEIIGKNQPVDFVTLSDYLDKKGELDAVGGVEYLIALTETVPSSANSQRYLNIVKTNSMLRKIIRSSADIISDCQESTDEKEALAFAEKRIFDISNEADTSDLTKIDKIIPDVMATLDELSNNKSAYRGIKTNFKGIDNLLNGLQKSDLIILAARPSVGKTSLAMNIVENVAMQGKVCVVFSLEMGKEQLVQRMMCSVAGVSME
ncbi:MAG: replicative DNA helicase, partial [Clostridia bacterium]|nr:replicative DNA helicase [Clostridia bacterium]